MKVTDAVLLSTLVLMVLIVSNTFGVLTSDTHSSSGEPDSEVVARWIINQLTDIRRDRRTQMDGGFFSRHSALQNFLNSYDESTELHIYDVSCSTISQEETSLVLQSAPGWYLYYFVAGGKDFICDLETECLVISGVSQ